MAAKIIPLYANEENGIYGDIYNTPEEVLEAHPGATVLKGFGILNTETGFLFDASDDFYPTEEAARADIEEM